MAPRISFFLGAGFAHNFIDKKNRHPLPLVTEVENLFRQELDDFQFRCMKPDSGRSMEDVRGVLDMPPSKCPISASLLDQLKTFYGQLTGTEVAKVNIEQCIGLMYWFDNYLRRAGCTFQNYSSKEFLNNPIWGSLIQRLGPHLGSNLIRDVVDIPLSKCFPQPMFTDGNSIGNLGLCDLFEEVFRRQRQLEIFSLNWDLVIETYYKHQAKVNLCTGFVDVTEEFVKRLPKNVRISDVKAWQPSGFNSSSRNLFKLHGSLNWKSIQPYKMVGAFRYIPDYSSPNDYPSLLEIAGSATWLNWLDSEDVGRLKLGQRVFAERKALLVGIEKEEQYLYEPYSSLISALKTSLAAVTHLYVIGYGFGDEGMNNILLSSFLQRVGSRSPLRMIIVSRGEDAAKGLIAKQPCLAHYAAEKAGMVTAFPGAVKDLQSRLPS
jgi:hypothetical protein